MRFFGVFIFFNSHLDHIYACLGSKQWLLGDIAPLEKYTKTLIFLAVNENFGAE